MGAKEVKIVGTYTTDKNIERISTALVMIAHNGAVKNQIDILDRLYNMQEISRTEYVDVLNELLHGGKVD